MMRNAKLSKINPHEFTLYIHVLYKTNNYADKLNNASDNFFRELKCLVKLITIGGLRARAA